uniref:Uncharacterized protein n=1 Tax=Triticum urartu TaxID=4572 RepID=A0A8R7K491_TRIUA
MLVWSVRDVAPPTAVARIGVGDVCTYQLHNSSGEDFILNLPHDPRLGTWREDGFVIYGLGSSVGWVIMEIFLRTDTCKFYCQGMSRAARDEKWGNLS